MIRIIFLLLTLAVLCTVYRLLWIFFPRIRSKSGKIMVSVEFGCLFLPLLSPIFLDVHPAYVFAVILVSGITAAALIDNRVGTTSYELYPVAVGLAAPIVIVSDLLQTESILYSGISSPVIGLLIGLGIAILAGMIEMLLSPAELTTIGIIEMAAVSGFFAGFPGVVWVFVFSLPLCFGAWIYRRRLPNCQNQISYSGCVAYALFLYLCFHPILGI